MIRESSKTPCKDCKDRVLYCHSTCDRYIEWKKEVDEYNRKMREEIEKYCVPTEVILRNKKKKAR